MKERIKISDYNLFCDIIKAVSKMSDGVKFSINDCGLTIYAKNNYSKAEITSNAITSDNQVEFCIGDLNMFMKILYTVKGLYSDSELNSIVAVYYDAPFLRIESSKFKTKISTSNEDKIINFIGSKVHTELTSQVKFTTNSNMIKSINSHSFIFNDSSEARIYLNVNSDMENNVIFATIGNENNDLANSVTLELGLINSGVLNDRKIVLNFDRLNVLNLVQSDEIVVDIAAERPVLMSTVRRNGTNGTFFNINIYSFFMVK